jgi:diguanylate cyclase (GGDEF)-like protein/PAS domain S-box-containing protein
MANRREIIPIHNPDFINPYIAKKNNPSENYQILVDDAPDLIFTTDLEGNFLYLNKTAQEVIKSASKSRKINLIKVATSKYQKELQALLKSIRRKKFPPPLEIEIKTAGGKLIPLEIQFKPIKNKQGIIVALEGIARNVTDRRKREETFKESVKKFETIIETAKDGVAVIQDGICKYANKAIENILGFSPDELVGTSIFEKLPPKERDVIEKRYHMRMAGKDVPSVYELNLYCKNKKTKKVEVSATVIQYDGRPADLGFIRDLSDRQQISNKMDGMNQQIERFSQITAALVLVEDAEDFLKYATQAVADISDFNRVLISYFIDKPPYREIIGFHGVRQKELDKIKKVEMPRAKYLEYFEQGIKLGNQSCYIPHNLKEILDQNAVLYGKKSYPEKSGYWNREDNLLVAMKNAMGQVIGIISVDDSKSGIAPTAGTVRPLEIFANLISEMLQRRILAKKMRESEEKYRELITNIKVGIFRMNPHGQILEANPAAVEMFGFKNEPPFLERNVSEFFPLQETSSNFMSEMANNGLVKNKEFCLKRKNGTQFWASLTSTAVRRDPDKILYYDTVIEDITKKKQLQEEVQRLSITDELTGLFNRRYFNQNLPKEIKNAERWRSSLSLIMIDIDDFKNYNDKYHHLKGDELLKEVASVISQNIRRERGGDGDWCSRFEENGSSIGDWASRFGGDEFAIILPGAGVKDALKVADRIRKVFSELSFSPKGTSVHKSLSLGIAYCTYSEREKKDEEVSKKGTGHYEKLATELTTLADAALFKAKNTGKNTIEIAAKCICLSR